MICAIFALLNNAYITLLKMKRNYLVLFFLLISFFTLSQDFSALWTGHYSYLNIKDVVEGNGTIYAASETAIFTYDPVSQEINTISTVNGLSGEEITTIHYSETYQLLLVGYESGLIDIYLESENDILTVVDIVDKPSIPPNEKRINHFNEYTNLVYIATDFGISVYDLERLEFGDTYFIGDGGAQVIVKETAVFEGFIYAACRSLAGMRKADINSDDLINFQEWDQIATGNFISVITADQKLYATRLNNTFFEVIPAGFLFLFDYAANIIDVKFTNGFLLVTLADQVFVYDADYNLLANVFVSSMFNSNYTTAIATSDAIYIGTDAFGVLRTTFTNTNDFLEIHPDGPLRNDPFSIKVESNNVWVSFGDHTFTYNPFPEKRTGVSNLFDEEWRNVRYDTIFDAIGKQVSNLNRISINPFNTQQVFISSFQHGILEINNFESITLYDEDNSGLESLVIPSNPNFKSIRVSSSSFDRDGILWTMTARVDKPLKSYDPANGQWQGFDFTEIIPDGLNDEFGFSDIIIDDNNTKWIGGLDSGLIGFNNEGGEILIKNINDQNVANLPSTGVQALALDRRNQLWIGTTRGLRVLFNTGNFFESNTVGTNAIIILEDGLPRELLEQQFISDIKVDGSNNKWVATIGAGLFYFSSDGQETIYHFTEDNSPLPSNNVVDVGLDQNTGEVYIATDRGLVSFRAGGSSPQDSLADAFVFPNPVRPTFNINDEKVKIKDISENCNIKIVDIEGNLVAEAQSNTNLRFQGYNLEIDGGTAFWNGKNLANNTVRTGVYLVMISDLDSLETKVLKLMVVR